MNMDFWRQKKESKSDPPTNREWLESLSTKQLAEFLTCGLYVRDLCEVQDNLPKGAVEGAVYVRGRTVNLKVIKMRYIQTHIGVEYWLDSPQEFEVIPEVE